MKECFPVLQENVTVREKMEGKEKPLKKGGGEETNKTFNYYLGIIRGRVLLLLLECRVGNKGTGSIAFGSLTPLIPGRCQTLLPKEGGSQGPLCTGQEGLAGRRWGFVIPPLWRTCELHCVPKVQLQMNMVHSWQAKCEIPVKYHHLCVFSPLSKVFFKHLLIPLQLRQINSKDNTSDTE